MRWVIKNDAAKAVAGSYTLLVIGNEWGVVHNAPFDEHRRRDRASGAVEASDPDRVNKAMVAAEDAWRRLSE